MFPDGDITGQNGRGLVFTEGDITGPSGRGLVFPDWDITGPDSQHGFRRVGLVGFDPSLEYSTDNVVLFWQPRPIFAVVAFVVYRRRPVIFLRGGVYEGRIGQAF